MFPTCLVLNELQRDIATKFMEAYIAANKEQVEHIVYEEECVISSAFTFSVHATGLGDVVTIIAPDGSKAYLDYGLEP